MSNYAIGAVGAVVILFVAAFIYGITGFYHGCSDKGGHVITTGGGRGFLCISSDGRILDGR